MPRSESRTELQSTWDDEDERRVNDAIRRLRSTSGKPVAEDDREPAWIVAHWMGHPRLLYYEGNNRFTSPSGNTYLFARNRIMREATAREINERRVRR